MEERNNLENYAEIGGVKVHYLDGGNPSGKPLVLMHGWGCDSSTVRSIQEAMADRCRVINVDLPGFGKSDEPPLLPDGRPWGVYEYADCIEGLISHLGLEKPILTGHSYGGRIAIVIGSRRPLDKMVLVDSAGIKPKRKLRYYIKVWSFKTYKKLLPLFVGKKKAARLIEKRRAKAGSADYRNSSPMMRSVMSRSVNQDLRHLLPSISASTLLIWGENDTATPLSDARLMERLIPDAGLVSFPGAGPYSFLDNPAQFRAVMRSFIK